jgi:UDP-N-acetylglucosamine:LPS N-acetylglucosamine transferase
LKKILILTAGFGEGEDVAAWNLREAIEHLAPDDACIEVLDLLDSSYGRFHDLLRHTFQAAVNRAPRLWHGFYQLLGAAQVVEGQLDGLARLRDSLRDVLLKMEPDVVVLTCPIYGFLIGEIHRDGRARDFTIVSLATDAVVSDSPWPRTPGDFFAVTNEAAARTLAAAGVPEERIRVFGFPVQIPFAQCEKRIARPDLAKGERPRVLYVINGARKKAPKLLDRLLEHAGWDVTVCVGRDTALDEMAREKAATAKDRVEVVGHTRRMPQLLLGHHAVIGRPEAGLVQEAIAARCPMIAFRIGSGSEEGNFSVLRQANAGVAAEKPREVVDWLERAFRDEGRLLALWRKNLEPLGRADSALNLARFVLEQAPTPVPAPSSILRALPAPEHPEQGRRAIKPVGKNGRLRHIPKELLLCDLHTHTTWSDGKLSIPELVDFYGQRGFDCLCVTDHLCDPKRLLGKLVNLTGLVIPPDEVAEYFAEIEREKKRAWAKYDLLLMAGVEFNKDGYTAKTSTHLLGVDLKQPIDPSLDLKQLISEIHAQGGLAIASHPHEMKSEWGKNTLYLWEHVEEYAPLLDAWEVANRDDIFNPIGLKKLPFIANSDFHKPKHIHSWKTVLYCEKEAEAIKHCIRVNRDVSLTLYRDHRFALDESRLHLPALGAGADVVDFDEARLVAK